MLTAVNPELKTNAKSTVTKLKLQKDSNAKPIVANPMPNNQAQIQPHVTDPKDKS